MDETKTDKQIRRLYMENHAGLDLHSFRSELAERLPRSRARRASRTGRLVSFATATVIVVVALGFGVNALVERLGQDDGVVVITGDSMSPGGTNGTAPAPATGATPGDTLPPVQTGDPTSHRWASIVQLTDNKLMDEVPYLQGNLLAWRGHDGHDYEIMLHDFTTGATSQLTDNQVDDWEPKVYGTQVAWMEGPYGGPWSLRLHDLSTGATQAVANGDVAYGQYQLKGDLLVWSQVTDPVGNVRVLNVATGDVQTIVGWNTQSHRVHARTDGRYVLVAVGREDGLGDLLLYDTRTGSEKTIANGPITDDWRYLDDRRLGDGAVVWSASDGHDAEIFLYDIASGATTQLTDNDTSDTEPEVGRGYVLWARTESLQDPGTGPTDSARDVILYERASGRERLLGQGFGRLAEDGSLALWSEWPQKAENLWFYDIERDQAAYLGTPGSGASWPDTVDRFVIWYSERLDANEPTAEIMVAAVAPASTEKTVSTADDTGTTGVTASERDATTLIRDFFAGPGAEFVKDLTITALQAKGDPGAIDLTLTISSDGSEGQLWTLNGLIFGAMRGDRWPTALQDATGLVLAALHAEVDYPTGEPDVVDVDCAAGALSARGPAPRYHMGGPDTTAAP